MKLRAPLEMAKNEIRNLVLHLLAADPSTPTEGQQYHDTVSHHPKYHDGTSFKDLTDALKLGGQDSAYHRARANHTGTQLASTVSDFDTQVRTNRLDQMAAPTADVSFNSRKITNLLDGTNPQDAVSFAQLELAKQGVAKKAAVEAAMTTNVNIANPGTAVFDGVTVATNERVLLTGQTTDAEKGIYVFNGSGVAMTRALDADVFAEIDGGTETFAQGGTANQGVWRQTAELAAFTGQSWVKVAGGSTYSAGDGLTESPAGTFNVGSSARIVVNANDVDLASGIVAPGSYYKVTVDTYGRVTAGVTSDRYSALVGNGALTTISITQATHGRAADRTLVVQVLEESTGDFLYPDVSIGATGTVTLVFAVAPASNSVRVTIM